MSLLTCTNLSLGYNGKIVAEDISFSIEEGDYLCIVGENGSGKSTLMKTILKLQPPLSGSITTGDNLEQKEIGYLPQQTVVQRDFPASVKEIVLSGCLNHSGFNPFYKKSDKDKAKKNMERMGITSLANKCYRELSGGQQQRVLLARALCATSKMLLLDEPVAGLDPLVTNEMYSLISDLNTRDKITIIMISHDITASINYATKILHLAHKPLFYGTTQEYTVSQIGRNFIESQQSALSRR